MAKGTGRATGGVAKVAKQAAPRPATGQNVTAGGKPNPGTKKDKRLKNNMY